MIEDLPSREFGTITPDRFPLFESTVTDNGSAMPPRGGLPVRSSRRWSRW